MNVITSFKSYPIKFKILTNYRKMINFTIIRMAITGNEKYLHLL